MKLAYMYATPDVTHPQITAIQGEIAPTLARIRRVGYSGVELLVREPRRIDANALELAIRREGLDLPAVCTAKFTERTGCRLQTPIRPDAPRRLTV